MLLYSREDAIGLKIVAHENIRCYNIMLYQINVGFVLYLVSISLIKAYLTQVKSSKCSNF